MTDKEEEILTYINNISVERVKSPEFIIDTIELYYSDQRSIEQIKEDIQKYACGDMELVDDISQKTIKRYPNVHCQSKIVDRNKKRLYN